VYFDAYGLEFSGMAMGSQEIFFIVAAATIAA
jgi:hypothetical protein